MLNCVGCKREFKSKGGLNSHKRWCKKWQKSGLAAHKNRIPLEERKKTPAKCPLCDKEFLNVYSMSAHKGHCSGASGTKQFDGIRGWSKDKILKPLEEVFTIHEKKRTAYVKRALIKLGIKEANKCENCGLREWMGEKITIELDHVNGNSLDNRLKNLRFLCPNCHSMTPTWRGRNIRGGSSPPFGTMPS
jgi:Zn finger protein HypA/HybF involved in hydrogenase expression